MNRNKQSSHYGPRNARGLALWIKIILGIFITGVVLTIVCGLLIFNAFKGAMDPKQTKIVANKICQLADPLAPPYDYAPGNMSVGGFTVAVVTNKETKALDIMIEMPKKPSDNAQAVIDKVNKGESLPGPASGGKTEVKNSMVVEKNGQLDVGGGKVYYVLGKAAKSSAASGGASGTASSGETVETFFGACDPPSKPDSMILFMIQQPEANKHLTVEEAQSFLANIKKL